MSLTGENNDDNDDDFKVRRVDASIKQELQPRRSDQDPGESESGRKENDDEGEHLLKEEVKEELAQMDWVRWDEEERLPEGWSYRETAAYGHFGRNQFPWERTNKVEALRRLLS